MVDIALTAVDIVVVVVSYCISTEKSKIWMSKRMKSFSVARHEF